MNSAPICGIAQFLGGEGDEERADVRPAAHDVGARRANVVHCEVRMGGEGADDVHWGSGGVGGG